MTDNGSPEAPPSVPALAQLTILFDVSTGQLHQVRGPIEDAVLFSAMIGAAVAAVIKHNAEKPKSSIILPAPGSFPGPRLI